jgi:glycosyltransferase involved in cell wall biosynthesis
MHKLVTIGIPVYKRLEYLPNALRIVAAQDYPNIELLISDNGQNGSAIPAIVEKHYSKDYRFRQNASTVNVGVHFNQLIHEASGEYFVLLPDDDEITPNYVSELMQVLENHPEASVALAKEETVDHSGNLIRSSKEVPATLSGPDFIRATWGEYKYGYTSLCTFLARTQNLVECGGFPDIWTGASDEDVLMVKLCVDNYVAFSGRCSFRKRYYETSMGFALDLKDLARGIKEYWACLESEPRLRQYSASHPQEWRELKRTLFDSAWRTYYFRWADLYRKRLPRIRWIAAAFHLPFIPGYYKRVVSTLVAAGSSPFLSRAKAIFPNTYAACKAAKNRIFRTI